MRMTNKRLNILGLISIIMIVVTVFLYTPHKQKEITLLRGSYLMGGLSMDDINTIIITKGSNNITLNRKDDNFTIKEKSGYLADAKTINELFTKCLDIKVDDFITNKKSNYKTLGLTKDTPESIKITFKDKNGKVISGIIVGNRTDNGRGNYIKSINKDDVYTSLDLLYFKTDVKEYLDKSIFNIKSKDISSISLKGKDGYMISKGPSDEVRLINPPEGKKVDKSSINSVFNVLVGLEFDDVAKASTQKLDFTDEFICKTKNKITYHILKANKGKNIWIKVNAMGPSAEDIQESRKISREDSEKTLKNKSSILDSGEIAKKFNQRTNEWVYKIPSFKAKDLNKKMNDLLKKEPSKKKNKDKP